MMAAKHPRRIQQMVAETGAVRTVLAMAQPWSGPVPR